MLTKKTILITGGTGSFGKKFTTRLLSEFPDIEKIIIFSRDEFKQFEMSNLPEFKGNSKLQYLIGDVRDKERLLQSFNGVDIVIHAAALKQVPVCEQNPFEAIKTNVIGAQNVVESAISRNVKKVIALSTDKACSPINLYGATKLCSDKIFIAGNIHISNIETKLSVVRYGNVAGSRGSVIPFFQKLIDSGAKELPITDPRMTRFWLKLDEAVDMVIDAMETMVGGELFVKKIPSMKIVELCKAMAPNLPLKNIGIRPGEKIHESMISLEDSRNTIELDKCYIIAPELDGIKERVLAKGKPVSDNFEYSSGSNKEWLTVEEMKELIYENIVID